MFTLLVILYIFVCIFLILVVLVQQGRGADLAGAFGGGGSQQTFGPRGATTFLHKLTTGFFVAFIVLALALAILESRPHTSVIREGPKNPRAQQKVPATFPAPTPAAPATTGAPAATGTSAPAAPAAPPKTQ